MMQVKARQFLLSLAMPLALGGCDLFSSEPVYSGISVEGMNYTPFNLPRFVIHDKYGNRAGGGGDLMPGAGEGSVSCCYKLKGTEFSVEWEVYDQDEFMKNPYAPIKKVHKTSLVKLSPTSVSGKPGATTLVAHFYPDDHVEFEFRDDLSGSRILYDEVWDWLRKKHGNLINPNGDDESVVFRRVAKLAANGWLKYGFEDTEDLQRYCLSYLLDPKFDEHPEVKRILQETKGKRGEFAVAMKKLPKQ